MARRLHIIETTLQTAADAEQIASLLVEESLAVCARLDADCRSWYRWRRAVHPYETPMILVWTVAWADPDYLAWAHEEAGA